MDPDYEIIWFVLSLTNNRTTMLNFIPPPPHTMTRETLYRDGPRAEAFPPRSSTLPLARPSPASSLAQPAPNFPARHYAAPHPSPAVPSTSLPRRVAAVAASTKVRPANKSPSQPRSASRLPSPLASPPATAPLPPPPSSARVGLDRLRQQRSALQAPVEWRPQPRVLRASFRCIRASV